MSCIGQRRSWRLGDSGQEEERASRCGSQRRSWSHGAGAREGAGILMQERVEQALCWRSEGHGASGRWEERVYWCRAWKGSISVLVARGGTIVSVPEQEVASRASGRKW